MNFPATYQQAPRDNMWLATQNLQYEDKIKNARTELCHTLQPTHPQYLEHLANTVRYQKKFMPAPRKVLSNNTHETYQALNTILWAVPEIRDRLNPADLRHLAATSFATYAIVAQVWQEKVAKLLGCSFDNLPKAPDSFGFKDIYRGMMILIYPLQNPDRPLSELSVVDKKIKAATTAYLDSFTDRLGTRLELNLQALQNTDKTQTKLNKTLRSFLLITGKLTVVCVGSLAGAVTSGYLFYHDMGCLAMEKLTALCGTNAAKGICYAMASVLFSLSAVATLLLFCATLDTATAVSRTVEGLTQNKQIATASTAAAMYHSVQVHKVQHVKNL